MTSAPNPGNPQSTSQAVIRPLVPRVTETELKAITKQIGIGGRALWHELEYRSASKGGCWPSLDTLAESLDVSRNTIKSLRDKLKAAGVIRIERRQDEAGRSKSDYIHLLKRLPGWSPRREESARVDASQPIDIARGQNLTPGMQIMTPALPELDSQEAKSRGQTVTPGGSNFDPEHGEILTTKDLSPSLPHARELSPLEAAARSLGVIDPALALVAIDRWILNASAGLFSLWTSKAAEERAAWIQLAGDAAGDKAKRIDYVAGTITNWLQEGKTSEGIKREREERENGRGGSTGGRGGRDRGPGTNSFPSGQKLTFENW